MKAIMYHYVRPASVKLPFFKFLNIEDFRKQLDYFQNELSFVSKEDFVRSFETGTAPKGVVLTFDDGFKDHFKYVLPELIKRDLWGIFYIPTAPYENNQLIDVHRIHMLLGKFGGHKINQALNSLITEAMLSHLHIDEFKTQTYENREDHQEASRVKRILNYFIDEKYRSLVIDQLMAQFFEDESKLRQEFYLTEEELNQMYKAGMVIGSHTVNHQVMSKLSVEKQRTEIQKSFKKLQKIVPPLKNEHMKTFCYPYGGFHTFNRQTEQILNEEKCLFSFNVEARDINTEDLQERSQALPRYDCNLFPHGQCRV